MHTCVSHSTDSKINQSSNVEVGINHKSTKYRIEHYCTYYLRSVHMLHELYVAQLIIRRGRIFNIMNNTDTEFGLGLSSPTLFVYEEIKGRASNLVFYHFISS